MKKTRLLHEALGVIFAASAALAVGIILSGLRGLPWTNALWFLPAILGQAAGRLTHRQGQRIAAGIGVAGVLLAAVLTSWGLYETLFWRWGLAGSGAVALCCFRWAYHGQTPCSSSLIACAMGLWVLALALCHWLDWPGAYAVLTPVCTTAVCLLGMAVLALLGARRSVRRGGGMAGRFPAGLRKRALLLAGTTLVLALLLSAMPFLHPLLLQGAGLLRRLAGLLAAGLGALWQGIVRLATWIWNWLLQWLTYDGSSVIRDTAPADSFTGDAFGSRILLLLCMIVLGLVLVSAITGGIFLALRAAGRTLKKEGETSDGFTEDVQREFSAKKLRQRIRTRLKTAFRREPRLSDFPDGAGKVRFAFSRWLRRCTDRNPLALTQTPNELQAQTGQAALTAYYNAVRYGGRDAPEDAERVAKEALAALRAQTGGKDKRKHE